MTQAAIKSVFAGVGGSVILAVFFTTFLPVDKILFIMPLVIGFNGLLTGFKLVEQSKTKQSAKGVFAYVMGLGNGALVFMAINFLGGAMANGFRLTLQDLLIYLFISGVTSYLGAKLAARYFNL